MSSFKNHLYFLFLLICVNQCLSDYKYQDITVICEEFRLYNNQRLYTNKIGDTSIINGSCDSSYPRKDLIIQGKIPVLGENSISNLPTELHTLNISNIGLEELNPGAFENLQSVLKLDLQNNKMKAIKKGVFDNISISEILFGNNEISEIEANAFGLSNSHWKIYALDLNSNKLEKINPDVFKNVDFLDLCLENNSIKKLRPGDFKNMPKLRILDLSRNFIKEIPNDVFNGSKLHTLNLDHNEISIIENEAFHDMTKLVLFSIRFNKLKQWNSHWFRRSMIRLRNLQSISISISYNKIEEIPDNAFQYMTYYRFNHGEIALEGNSIKRISDKAFSGLNNVYYLNLSHNNLEEWKENWLNGVKVDKIDLTFNKLCQDERSSSIVPQAEKVFIEKCKN